MMVVFLGEDRLGWDLVLQSLQSWKERNRRKLDLLPSLASGLHQGHCALNITLHAAPGTLAWECQSCHSRNSTRGLDIMAYSGLAWAHNGSECYPRLVSAICKEAGKISGFR